MVTHFDEKGKIYTDIIQKQAVWVTIQLPLSRIHATIYIRSSERLKEALDGDPPFLALTQAEIFSVDGKISEIKSNFLVINKSQIIWIMPDSEQARTE
ncbi:MAG: hypothetical protein AB9897_09415 [Anaerolineaceae bacterium]